MTSPDAPRVGSSVPGDTEKGGGEAAEFVVGNDAMRAAVAAAGAEIERSGQAFVSPKILRRVLAAAAPLLVSAQAERLRAQVASLVFALTAAEDTVAAERAAHARTSDVAEGLRAELAELRDDLFHAREEAGRPTPEPSRARIVAAAKVLHDEDSLMDPKPHSYERLSLPARIAYEDVAARVLAAALRAAGGQEKPNSHEHVASWPDTRCIGCGTEMDPDEPCHVDGSAGARAAAASPVGGQAEPSDAQIAMRTQWQYSDREDCICCPGKHAFTQGGYVTSSAWPSRYEHEQHWSSHVHRAIESFGDNVDVVISFAAAAVSGEQAQPDGDVR